MIFAAGLGTRLRPLTDNRPKALVEVGGVAMLERVIRRLVEAGADKIVVNVHHFPDMVIDWLAARDFGVEIVVSDERECLLDTGGGILKARPLLDGDEPFIVHNADILTDLDLRAMVDAHHRADAVATLLVAPRQSSRYLLFDDAMTLSGWTNVKTGEVRPAGIVPDRLSPLAFGGVHVISPAIFPLLEEYARSEGDKFSITPFYVDICRRAVVKGYLPATPYRWYDIGSPAKLAACESDLKICR